MTSRTAIVLAVVVFMAVLQGCTSTVPRRALEMTEVTLEQRALQSRRYSTQDETRILKASAQLLQDLGFSIDASETELGLIAGSKERDATDAGQVAGAVVIGLLLGVSTPVDDEQKIRASIVTKPTQDGISVRVTFQRIVWNTYGQVSRLELLDEVDMYEEFFDKLSKAVFLEAHQI